MFYIVDPLASSKASDMIELMQTTGLTWRRWWERYSFATRCRNRLRKVFFEVCSAAVPEVSTGKNFVRLKDRSILLTFVTNIYWTDKFDGCFFKSGNRAVEHHAQWLSTSPDRATTQMVWERRRTPRWATWATLTRWSWSVETSFPSLRIERLAWCLRRRHFLNRRTV